MGALEVASPQTFFLKQADRPAWGGFCQSTWRNKHPTHTSCCPFFSFCKKLCFAQDTQMPSLPAWVSSLQVEEVVRYKQKGRAYQRGLSFDSHPPRNWSNLFFKLVKTCVFFLETPTPAVFSKTWKQEFSKIYFSSFYMMWNDFRFVQIWHFYVDWRGISPTHEKKIWVQREHYL